MEKFKNKVNRKHIAWKSVMDDLGDLRVSERYWFRKVKSPRMSDNRCAYYALKCYYSTAAINYYRMFGEWPNGEM